MAGTASEPFTNRPPTRLPRKSDETDLALVFPPPQLQTDRSAPRRRERATSWSSAERAVVSLMMVLPSIQMESLGQQGWEIRRWIELTDEDVAHVSLPPGGYGTLSQVGTTAIEVVPFQVGKELEAVAEDRVIMTACRLQLRH